MRVPRLFLYAELILIILFIFYSLPQLMTKNSASLNNDMNVKMHVKKKPKRKNMNILFWELISSILDWICLPSVTLIQSRRINPKETSVKSEMIKHGSIFDAENCGNCLDYIGFQSWGSFSIIFLHLFFCYEVLMHPFR